MCTKLGWAARLLALGVGSLAVTGCAGEPEACRVDVPRAVASSGASPGAPPVPATPPRFEERFDVAVDAARAGKKLVFVDAWAPWCHTCLSMRKEVLDRPELSRFSDRIVFAAIDTDRPESAAFLERYAMRVWPTFFVIDPENGAVLAMYGGSGTLGEIEALLEAGLVARAGRGVGERKLAEAHDAYVKKDAARAADLYVEAAGTVSNARRAEALLGAIRALSELGKPERCVEYGTAHAAEVPGSSTPIDFTYYLKECVDDLAAGAAKDEAAAFVRARVDAFAAEPPSGASVDDRADLLGLAAEIAEGAGDKARATKLQEERLALLEAAAAQAKTPEEAHVYDYERMGALLALGRGAEAVRMFEGRTADLPTSYEPYARLASTLLAMNETRAALAPLDKAIELSYGPRRLRYLASKSDALTKLGDLAGAVKALEIEVAGWRALPASQGGEPRVAAAEKRLAAARDKLAGKPAEPTAARR
ncbi:MAG TPA: thioredoxin family protein [Polyangiaceae bacterium]|nr:thioredoxin family protein [Polyangiaceae bacterium]